jgi:FxsC-like protein
MSHWFFLSYSRNDADAYLEQFLTELSAAVRMKVGGRVEDIAFIDKSGIRAGDDWTDALGDALQGSRVLLPLYTRDYFARPNCGREWTVFLRRQAAFVTAGGAERPPVILPVLWAGEKDLPQPLPEVARGVQYGHGTYGDEYARLGAWRLMRRPERTTFVEALADRIVEIGRTFELPSLEALPDFPEIPNAFAAAVAGDAVAKKAPGIPEGPRHVQFIFVAGTREELGTLRDHVDAYGARSDDWRPFHPEAEAAIREVAVQVAGSEGFYTEPLPLGPDLTARLDAAEAQHNVVAMIVDTWTLRLADYHTHVREYDRRAYANCVVLVPWNDADAESMKNRPLLQQAVQATFARRLQAKDPATFLDAIGSPDDLRRSLASALAAARANIIRFTEVQRRVESANVFRKPIISGSRSGSHP